MPTEEVLPDLILRIGNDKSVCGKVSRVRHMVPGGSRESLPKRKVRFADIQELGNVEVPLCHISEKPVTHAEAF